MKFLSADTDGINGMSRPARGAWIEILRILLLSILIKSRAPHGARGLKFYLIRGSERTRQSRPARGAWIEIIGLTVIRVITKHVAPRTGRVD